MSDILINSNSLMKRRIDIERLFRPICRAKKIEVFRKSDTEKIIIGLGPGNFGNSARDARYPSKKSSLFINYFEIWYPDAADQTCSLDKAYMHLDMPNHDGTFEEEVLALHCDPTIDKMDPAYIYKRGPHMHIPGHKWKIDKAHIALCVTNLDQTCSTIDSLTDALASIIKMIDAEILPQFI